MSYRYEEEYYEEQPRRRLRGWLLSLTILVWLLVLACVLLRFVIQPALTDFVNRRIARTIDPNLPASFDPIAALRDRLASIPSGPIPAGEFTVTEEQANAYVAAYRPQVLDEVQVHFVPREVQADLTWRGITSTARMGVEARNGHLVAVNPRLDPPLGAVLSIDALVGVLEDRLNDELTAQGRRITHVEVQQDIAVVTIE
jgi:hypothetical protein